VNLKPGHHNMSQKIQDILKRINYIEAEIAIQKQILFSLPSNSTLDMENVIKDIAERKEEIATLRQEILRISPEEHQKIVTLEQAVATFKKLADDKKFTFIKAMEINKECFLSLKNGQKILCLIKALQKNGGWTIISMEGEIQYFTINEVDEKPEESIRL
jgi:hypothetical protein